jgi:ABC-2 type transport system ATP-binding protein
MSADIVLRTSHLKKHFGGVKAVEDVSLGVRRGEIFGFLGPNGAGKTTTISMMLCLTQPTAGQVEVLGQRVTPGRTQMLRCVGTMVGTPALLPFSARANLRCLAYLYPNLPRNRIEETLELVGLAETARRPARTFSAGMRQRLGLALALLNQPELLILDEPTNGMDPAGIHEVRGLLRGLASRGVTVFLSSHLLHEVELLCDRVAVVHYGQVIAQGAVADLLGAAAATWSGVSITTSEPERTAQVLRGLPGAHDIQVSGARVEVQGLASEAALGALVAAGLTPREVAVSRPDLERVFLALTQKAS